MSTNYGPFQCIGLETLLFTLFVRISFASVSVFCSLRVGLQSSMADEKVKQGVEEIQKPPTAEDFITNWPLYTAFEFESYRPPSRISFHCDGPECGKETTWVLTAKAQVNQSPYFRHVHYQCSLCEKRNLVVFYLEQNFRTNPVIGPQGQKELGFYTQVVKIGQYPALSIAIPKALRKNLGEGAASLYKKALVCRNEGYGLAAVTYIRRVVEDKTDELIDVVSDLAASHNVEPETIKKIRAAKDERTTYDNKLKIAATVFPDSLVIDGVNPLGELYSLVSAGIHDLTEEECIAVADETKSVFEFTFSNLRAETKKRRDFVSKVKKWAGGKRPQKDGQK